MKAIMAAVMLQFGNYEAQIKANDAMYARNSIIGISLSLVFGIAMGIGMGYVAFSCHKPTGCRE